MLDLRERLGEAHGTKAINRKRVVLAVAVKADTQVNIARRVGLAESTVSTIVRDLQRDGVFSDGRGGRSGSSGRGSLVSLAPSRSVGVGVHLGFSHVTVLARRLDQPPDRAYAEYIDSGATRGLRDLMPSLRRAVQDAVARTGCTPDDVVSAGMGVPGMINPRTGRFSNPVITPWRREDRPAAELAEWLGVPEALDNDANLGALAEQIYGAGDDAEIVVYVKAATGVGAGIVLAGVPVRGRHGIAGEIGHLSVDPMGEICYCGGRGCLETLIGADALLRQVRTTLTGRAADVPHTLTALISNARGGDVLCRRVMQEAGRTLGRALAHMGNLLNPDLIVIGGQLADAGELLLGPCREALAQGALSGAVEGLVVKTSSLGEKAEAQGGLVLGLDALRLRDDPQDATD